VDLLGDLGEDGEAVESKSKNSEGWNYQITYEKISSKI